MSYTELDLEKLTADLIGRMETASRACFRDGESHSDWPHYCALCVGPVLIEALREITERSDAVVKAAEPVSRALDGPPCDPGPQEYADLKAALVAYNQGTP